jgi:hypothetical protein
MRDPRLQAIIDNWYDLSPADQLANYRLFLRLRNGVAAQRALQAYRLERIRIPSALGPASRDK